MPARRFTRVTLLTAVVASLLVSGVTFAQQAPRSVNVGTQQPGTVQYSVASGLAKVVNDAAPFSMVVQAHSGATTFYPMLNSGELDFGLSTGIDLAMGYRGPERMKVAGKNPHAPTPNARLVMRGLPFTAGLLVRKDSPIKTIQDVRGKRLTGEYPAQLGGYINMFAHLASAGMTFSDVVVVPVTGIPQGIDAVVQGRADVTTFGIGAAKAREADAAVGIRHISTDCSPAGQERIRKAVPGYHTRVIKAGTATGVVEDTCVTAWDLYLATHKGAADAVVGAVVKALWENADKLGQYHPQLKLWTRDRFVDPEATIPYHPAAVQFYKAHGVWPAKMDDLQQKLLALNPQ